MKYRVWFESTPLRDKHMVSWKELKAFKGLWELLNHTGRQKNYHVMLGCEFDGQMLYEQDIVRITDRPDDVPAHEDDEYMDYVAMIIFKDGGFCAIDGLADNYAVRNYALAKHDYNIQLLGNTYENPELIPILEGEEELSCFT